mmetsp:Transcript_21806/g.42906  ORF Transcript_21806/g.42906 Transcript_21806/m.42906 type:complete len:96 (+) Transcript_21806:65-352(+)
MTMLRCLQGAQVLLSKSIQADGLDIPRVRAIVPVQRPVSTRRGRLESSNKGRCNPSQRRGFTSCLLVEYEERANSKVFTGTVKVEQMEGSVSVFA